MFFLFSTFNDSNHFEVDHGKKSSYVQSKICYHWIQKILSYFINESPMCYLFFYNSRIILKINQIKLTINTISF